MKIRLSANSIEAKEYLSNLNGIECGYAYSYGLLYDEEIKQEQSWALNVFSKIDKLLSKRNPLPENSKNIVKAIGQSANLLENSLSKEDQQQLQNMHISMSVPSSFNSHIKRFVSNLSGNESTSIGKYFDKLGKGIIENQALINPIGQKMIISSDIFDIEKNYSPLFKNLINDIGLERTVEFVVFHEASHAFQYTNLFKQKPEWDDNISQLMKVITQGAYSSSSPSRFYGKTQIHDINGKIETDNLNFKKIESKYLEQLQVLIAEIYADVGSILLSRNADIKNGNYSKEKSVHLISSSSKARMEEQDYSSKEKGKILSSFNHLTSPGLEYLKEIFDQIPDKSLSQKEINKYCNDCITTGIARIIITSTITDPNKLEELKTLFHVSVGGNKNNLEISDNPDIDLTKKRFDALKKAAGKTWFSEFSDDVKKIQDQKLTGADRLYWIAGLNKDSLEKSISRHIQLQKELSEIVYDKYFEPNQDEQNKETTLNSIMQIRNKTLDQKSSLKNKIM